MTIVLVLTLVFHVMATALALHLARTTRAHAAGILVAMAITILAVRSIVQLEQLLVAGRPPQPAAEVAGLVFAVLMCIGIAAIRPWFRRTQRADEELRRANRALRTVTACNEALVRATSEEILLRNLCEAIVDVGKYRLAWIGYAQDDAERSVRPVAHAGHDQGYIEALHLTWADPERGHGPAATAIRTGLPQIVADIGSDPRFAPWQQDALTRGYRSSIAMPLVVEGRVIGALNVFAGEPHAFGGVEQELLRELADDLAFGIGAHRSLEREAQTEQVLRRTEERLASVVQHAPMVLWTLDPEGTFTLSEGRGLEGLGLRAGEMVGQSVFEAYADHPDILADTRRALAGEATTSTVVVNDRTFDVRYSPLYDGAGGLAGTIGVGLDVTDRRALEEQLRQAQKMEAIGQLTSGIAHDFNNLLSVILLYTQFAHASSAAGDLVDPADLECVAEAAQKASLMIRQLLGYSRHAALRPVPTDLGAVARQIEGILRRTLPEDIVIELAIEEPLPLVIADPQAVDQMLLNLATNARDAMPSGGQLRISVGAAMLDEAYTRGHPGARMGMHVCLGLSDTGIGMDAEEQRRAFEPFFTTKPAGKGTGLGLPMVYGLMKQHHGFVDLTSVKDHGTSIRLYFPVTEYATPTVPARAPESTPPRRGRETILLVEDEEQLRLSAQRVLTAFGYQVITAADGIEALDRWQAHSDDIHLVLSDVVMPRMNGVQLYEALRRARPGVRFVLASGYGAGEATLRGRLDPSVPVVEKPWEMTRLLASVRRVLDGQTL
jgi:PAS domain S-box-containing protein